MIKAEVRRRKDLRNFSCETSFATAGGVFSFFNAQGGMKKNGGGGMGVGRPLKKLGVDPGLTFGLFLRHVHRKATLSSTQSDEKMSHGEEFVRGVV